MGLDVNGTRLLLYAKRRGLDLQRTATLGRQGLHLSSEQLAKNFSDFGRPLTTKQASVMLESENGYCEPVLHALGAEEVISFDNSLYEHASELHDFNRPISPQWDNAFTTVLDAGSLEHIFNFPVALSNCLRMVAPNGHFLAITPANNTFGHGFYQFGPELFYRSCSEQNGFQIVVMMAYETDASHWFEVFDPAVHGQPIVFRNRRETHLFVMARKMHDVPLFATSVQQGIYTDWVWKRGRTAATSTPASVRVRQHVPERLRIPLRAVRSWFRSRGRSAFSERYFKRVETDSDNDSK